MVMTDIWQDRRRSLQNSVVGWFDASQVGLARE